MTFAFVEAVKEQELARIAIEGPSGSGKTFTALTLARGLGQRVGVIDTERRRAILYANTFAFKHLSMRTFDPADLIEALHVAAAAGIDVLIIDSLSHFWMGTGGILAMVDQLSKRNAGGNQFGGWKDVRPIERAMFDTILAYPGHVIVTMRSKSEWVVSDNERGKKEPTKIGLKAEQRDGVEYEFDIVGALDLQHNWVIHKSRMSDLADQVIAKPGTELATQILEWLNDGTRVPTVAEYVEQARGAETLDQLREIYDAVEAHEVSAAPCVVDGHAMPLLAYILERRAELTVTEQPAARTSENATDAELSTLNALITEKVGEIPRGERLEKVSEMVERPLKSAADLKRWEIGKLFEKLRAMPGAAPSPQEQASMDAHREAEALAATAEPGSADIEAMLVDQISSASNPGDLDLVTQSLDAYRVRAAITQEQYLGLDGAVSAQRKRLVAQSERARERAGAAA